MTDLPATFLWLHYDLEVFIDDSSRYRATSCIRR